MVAGTPSSSELESRLPAMVLMIPAGLTFRMQLFPLSAMYRVPSFAAATLTGYCNEAFAAGPPSPAKRGVPSPAAVVTMPSDETLRTRCAS